MDRSGNIERFFDDFCQNFPFPYCNRIFADAPCNADNIHLLECVIANQVCRYLPRKAYQRNAVIICSGNSADEKVNVSPEENPQPSLFDTGPEGAPAQDAPAPICLLR